MEKSNMRSTDKELYDIFLSEVTASSTHIECTIAKGPGGKITVSASGHKASLFCGVCEILKCLAQKESKEPNVWRRYVEAVCEQVLKELERGGKIMQADTIMAQLMREAEYAQRSLLRDTLFEIYGKAEMARQLDAITKDEFMELNHMTIYFINTHARELG